MMHKMIYRTSKNTKQDKLKRCPATKSGIKDRTADRNPFVISRNINRIAAVILDAITRAIAAPASVLTINIKDQCYLEDDPTIFTKDLEGTVIAALVETPKMETVKVPAVASTITSTIENGLGSGRIQNFGRLQYGNEHNPQTRCRIPVVALQMIDPARRLRDAALGRSFRWGLLSAKCKSKSIETANLVMSWQSVLKHQVMEG
uniref:(northern house mosquito) hypothetical protein n=1 Tax=Culex pipiens TaxID=7175 RepID=A0A8D8CV93_CULPI